MIGFFIKYYFPLVIWAAIIFYFSSIPGLRYAEEIEREILLRKGAHFVEYGILAILVWRLFYLGHHFSKKRSFLYSLTAAVLYAVSDEFHQGLVYGRTGKLEDVVFDSLSILFALEAVICYKAKTFSKKIFLWLALTFLAMLTVLFMMFSSVQTIKIQKNNVPDNLKEYPKITDEADVSEADAAKNNTETKAEKEIPGSIKIFVPFTSQAPFASWDEYHEEACEEASLIMIAYYLNKLPLPPDVAEKEILDLIGYQKKYYGNFEDTTVAETAELGEKYFGIKNLKVVYDFSSEDLKRYLSYGKPIIIPAAGRLLGNPYFTQPGPLYHNLVLTGYNGDTIITNDPGTKRGKDYEYDIKTLYNAIHDFPGHPEDIEKGRKAMIIME